MNRFYNEGRHKKKNCVWKGKSPYKRYSKSGKGKKTMIVALSLIVGVVALFQFTSLSTAQVKGGMTHFTAALQNTFTEASDWASAKLGLEDDNSFLLPVSSGVVVEDYGVVLNEKGEESYHSGVDIKVPAGSEVLVAEAGEVTAIDTHEDSTYWITVSHKGGWSTVYGRLGQVSVEKGAALEKGAVLGTPQSETLHFEVLENGSQKNPVKYFEAE